MKKYWNWKKTTGLMMACAVICGTTGIALAEEKQDGKASAVETVRTYEGDEGDMWTIVNKKDTIFKYIFWERLDSLPIPECCFHFIWC